MIVTLNEFINQLRANGRYTFTSQEAQIALNASLVTVLKAIHRLKKHKVLVSPAKGFYLIVLPEYQAFGGLPADLFVHNLMQFLELPYYVGYLSAAQYYGAAHQKPQRFQVVTSKSHRPIRCGRVLIEFIKSNTVRQMPIRQMKTASGYINVAEPEVVALDMVSHSQYAAGISNVATVLAELAESFDMKRLDALAKVNTESAWIQRLGYLSEFLGLSDIADELFNLLENKKNHWIKLVPALEYEALSRDSKWKVIVNTEVEPDL